MNSITLEQRLAIATAYLDNNIPLRTIGDLSGVPSSELAKIARQVLGEKYFVSRYKNTKKTRGTLL